MVPEELSPVDRGRDLRAQFPFENAPSHVIDYCVGIVGVSEPIIDRFEVVISLQHEKKLSLDAVQDGHDVFMIIEGVLLDCVLILGSLRLAKT